MTKNKEKDPVAVLQDILLQPTPYQARQQLAYQQRLATFTTTSYFGRPAAISPLQCAALGWQCCPPSRDYHHQYHPNESVLQCTQCAAHVVVTYKRGVTESCGHRVGTTSSTAASGDAKSITTTPAVAAAFDVLTRWYTTQLVTAHVPTCSFRTMAERSDEQDQNENPKEKEQYKKNRVPPPTALQRMIPRRWMPYMPRQVLELTQSQRPLQTLGAQVQDRWTTLHNNLVHRTTTIREETNTAAEGVVQPVRLPPSHVLFPSTVQDYVPPPLPSSDNNIDDETNSTPSIPLLSDRLAQVLIQSGWFINHSTTSEDGNHTKNKSDIIVTNDSYDPKVIGQLALLTLLGWYHPEQPHKHHDATLTTKESSTNGEEENTEATTMTTESPLSAPASSLSFLRVCCPLCRATWDMSPLLTTTTTATATAREASAVSTPPAAATARTTASSPFKRRRIDGGGITTPAAATTFMSKNALTAHRHYCPYVSGFPHSSSSSAGYVMTPPFWKTLVDQIFLSSISSSTTTNKDKQATTMFFIGNDDNVTTSHQDHHNDTTNVWVQVNALFHTGLAKPTTANNKSDS
jgi:hypothetical protein